MVIQSQRGVRQGNSYKSQIVTFYQDIADFLDEGARRGTIVIDFSFRMIGCLRKLRPRKWIRG
jgi:hypothetical protein